MPAIQQLPPELVNQIAAGEVLERPSSAVKELVENALDAGALRIVVELAEGGRDLIRVVDDGCGIPREELPLAVASHATSKLRTAEDLFRVRSFGFRGEALASIASVSDFTIRSRPHDAEVGAELRVVHGRIGEVRDCGGPPGTTIEVRDLFGSVPVRRKFLKARQTELAHAVEALTRVALANAGVALELRHNERTTFARPAGSPLPETVRLLFGDEVASALLPVAAASHGSSVKGFVGGPQVDRPNSRGQHFFVNGRWFRDRSLSHAVGEGFRGLMMTGRYPLAFLFFEIPPEEVDVNVHPQKTEVRFHDPHRLYSLTLSALRQRMLASDLTPKLRPPDPTTAVMASADDEPDWFARPAAPNAEPSPENNSLPPFRGAPFGAGLGGVQDFALNAPATPDAPNLFHPSTLPPAPLPAFPRTVAPPTPAPAFRPAARAWQLHNLYLVVEEPDGMLLVDQHALHERILFEELKAKALAGAAEVQELLIPEPVELPAAQAAAVLEAKDDLARLGLIVDDFGDRCVVVRGVPAILPRLSPASFIKDLGAKLADAAAPPRPEEFLDAALAMAACKAAVKAGDPLAQEEIDALLARRRDVEESHHCPHGRPTVLRLSLRELEKQFKRV